MKSKLLFVLIVLTGFSILFANSIEKIVLPEELISQSDIEVRIYNGSETEDPIYSISHTHAIGSREIELELPGSIGAEREDLYYEIISGGEIIVDREPLERPAEPMAVGLQIGNATEELEILSNMVGIGTASPNARLVVSGTDVTSTRTRIGYNGSFNNVESGRLNFDEDVNAGGICGFEFHHDGNANKLFLEAGCPSMINVITFQRNGNVGIGTTGPGAKLDVAGTAEINGQLDMQSNKIVDLATPTAGTDAATKAYVDGAIASGGDNLGNHTATTTLNMSDQWILNCEGITGNTSASATPFLSLADGSYVEAKSASADYGLIVRDYNSSEWIDIDANNMEIRNSTGNLSINTDGDIYLNPGGSQTYATDFRPNIIYDRNNTSYYLDPSSTGLAGYFNGYIRASVFYDRNNTSYYLDPASTSYCNAFRANIFYDRNSTTYYWDGTNSGTSMRVGDNISIGYRDASDDDYIYFDNDGQYLRWENSSDRFYFSNDLYLNGALVANGMTLNGPLNMNGYYIYNASRYECTSASSYDKLRVYPSSTYTIGMHSGMSYGHLNDWAMTFTFNNESDRGFLWRDSDDATSDGAMALTTNGLLTVKNRVESPIYYDLNSTGYYGNFASTSRMNYIYANYISAGTSPSSSYRVRTSGGTYGLYASGHSYGVYASGSSYGVYGVDGSYYGYLGYGSYGVYGYGSYGGYFSGTSYGLYSTSSGSYGLYAYGSGSYGVYGYRPYGNYGSGRATVYGYRGGYYGETNGGTSYYYSSVDVALHGYSYYGNNYSFGVAGHNFNDYKRTGGAFGAYYSGSYWGSLGYKNSGGSGYGGYFTSYTSGGGRRRPTPAISSGMDGEAHISVGIGAWGDLFGEDIHGEVYGSYIEGGRYALYTDGDRYTKGMDIHLTDVGDENMAVSYTNTSTRATISMDGVSELSGGSRRVDFDESFRKLANTDGHITVTATPMGPSNGIYITDIGPDGFTVVENHDGNSDVSFTWIAIAERIDAKSQEELPPEVVSADYTEKLSRGLHNDCDTQTDGEGLYFQNGELIVGMHESVLPNEALISLKEEFAHNMASRSYEEWESAFQSIGYPIPLGREHYENEIQNEIEREKHSEEQIRHDKERKAMENLEIETNTNIETETEATSPMDKSTQGNQSFEEK